LPEPLGTDRDSCSGLIVKCHGGGILPKFMEAEHVVKPGLYVRLV
jgi:hypothetical protein